MTQARDLADGKFDTNTLVVDAANNRVGVGTASPSTNLDITGSGGQVTVDANGHLTSKQSLDAATAGGRIIGASNRGTVSQIDLAQTTSSADGGYIRFLTCDSGSTNPTERMRLLSGGGLTFNGDTATANALDDYEEGTWTASLGATSVNPTFSSQGNSTGHYVKVGDIVHFTWYNAGTVFTSSGTGGARISGLPYTAANGTQEYWIFQYVHGTAMASGTTTGGYININNTLMTFVNENTTGSPTWRSSGTGYIMVSGSYRAA